MGRMQAAVDIQNVVKRYGDVTALAGVNISIQPNEFFTLLGPSGCGKTTLLRAIAGFEDVSSGSILLYGQPVADLPPDKRPVNTVFQQYALFPHLSVAQNVGFGLKMQGVEPAALRKRVGEMLDLVHLAGFADRMPAQLSGGQQQRVALARALAPAPKVLLLDEPLSALDLKLRLAMRVELKAIHEATGITFVFVTHDQEEALTMSDRIAVMSQGRVQQIGAAREIYEAPVNRFVADFIGETNVLEVEVKRLSGGLALCLLPGGREVVCASGAGMIGEAEKFGAGSHVEASHVSVRPERLSVVGVEGADLTVTVGRIVYLGTDLLVLARLAGGAEVSVRLQNALRIHVPQVGAVIGLKIEEGAARLLAD